LPETFIEGLVKPLPKRRLGQTDLELSILGLGTVKLGRNQGVKYPASFQLPDDRQAANLLALAWDLGINLLDTAPAYGSSEERLGQLLHGQRQRWLLCTKVGEEFSGGESHFDFSRQHIQMSIERSLARLRTDYLDLVLVHSDGNDVDIIEQTDILATLAEIKAAGKIRAFGVSTKTVAGGLLAAERSDCVMVTWNLHQQEEVAVIDHCQALGKGVLIKKALASGHAALGDASDPVRASFAMIFGHPAVTSAIVGTINPNHLHANAIAANSVTNPA
jgi:aryl-alcohol dehydrogenase-like predicted oxidoreductase